MSLFGFVGFQSPRAARPSERARAHNRGRVYELSTIRRRLHSAESSAANATERERQKLLQRRDCPKTRERMAKFISNTPAGR